VRGAAFRGSHTLAHAKKEIPLTTFQDFNLNDAITRAIAEEKYVTPTPIQTQTIPAVMSGRDVIGIAQTGTGKTAAFALPVLHRLAGAPRPLARKTCRVLVLSPTRELSGQILDSFRTYGRHLRIHSALAIGGVSMGAQVRSLLNGVDVLVATPGRLLDLVKSNALRLNEVECFVLDEADRMCDMGFINDVRKIVAKLPAQRQTLMFSATMPRTIAELVAQMLRDPVKVEVTPVASTVELIEQRIIRVDRSGKPAMLLELLRKEPIDRALIFTRTKHGADKVVRGLVQEGIDTEAIHGNKSQNQRERALANFRKGTIRVLVATDIAARGIDIDGVSHVVNFDLPNVPETYVHRIGRTARAGSSGIAISLCDAEEMSFLRDIEKLIRIAIPASGEHAHPRRPHAPSGQRPAPGNAHHRGGHRNGQNHNGQNRNGQSRKRRGNHGRGSESAHGLESVAFLHGKDNRRPHGAPAHQAKPAKKLV
jgi:superfamily II DNA/RNA helicase